MATPQRIRSPRAASTEKRLEELGVRIARDGEGGRRRYDLTDCRFGRLAVLHCVGKIRLVYHWHCRCDCGNEPIISVTQLVHGKTRSCGCLRNDSSRERHTTHGESHSREHCVWVNMKERCLNQKNNQYKNYGGRGITVCPEWLGIDGFATFFAHVGRKPSPAHTLDRIDNNGNYEPGNVRWATVAQQVRNKRNNRWETFNGETKTRAEWAREFNIDPDTLRGRLNRGWPFIKAVTAPVKQLERLIEFKGRKWTLAKWARYLGVTYQAIAERLKTMPVQEALTLPKNAGRTRFIEFRGERLPIKEWSDRLGISVNTIRSRINRCGWSVEKTFTTPAATETVLMFQGEERGIAEWARILGVDVEVIRKRLKAGWHTEEALTTPIRQQGNDHITYRGETRLLHEWASIFGVNSCTLRNRLRKGWTPEEILETPVNDHLNQKSAAAP